MSTPPPLPVRDRPVQYVHFEGEKMGLQTAAFDRERLEKARAKAAEWINANPQVEILSIDSTFGNLLAIVTVWYR